jgi:hypothetical protein
VLLVSVIALVSWRRSLNRTPHCLTWSPLRNTCSLSVPLLLRRRRYDMDARSWTLLGASAAIPGYEAALYTQKR